MLGLGMGMGRNQSARSLQAQAAAILRRPGITSALWMSGVGSVYGLAAGNYVDPAFSAASAVDTLVGGLQPSIGSVGASQIVVGSRPVLRRGLVNRISNSHNRQAGTWSGTNAVATGANTVAFTGGFHTGTYDGPAAGATYTQLLELSGTPGDIYNIYLQDNGGAYDATIQPITVTATPTLYAVTRTVTVASVIVGINSNGGTKTATIGKTGLFLGTITPARVIAAGGIPVTAGNPASATIGPYFWDAFGGKTLGATFPSGWENTTVIDAAPSGQSTLAGQNIVGAYSLNTDTSGRIFVSGTLSVEELATLQTFANTLAGL